MNFVDGDDDVDAAVIFFLLVLLLLPLLFFGVKLTLLFLKKILTKK